VEKQILIILSGTSGILDDLPVEKVKQFENELLAYADARYAALLAKVVEKKALDDDLRTQLHDVLVEFKKQFVEQNLPQQVS